MVESWGTLVNLQDDQICSLMSLILIGVLVGQFQ